MKTVRMTHDLRRELILGAAKRCFALHGYAGTTTKSVAAAAAISEGLLFKHFPSKLALFAEILSEECEADTKLLELRGLEPSTATLVLLIRRMVEYYVHIADAPAEEDAQRLRLVISSQLGDGEFARMLYGKMGEMLGSIFSASLDQAIRNGEATRVGAGDSALNLLWFVHHTLAMAASTQLPVATCLTYLNPAGLDRQLAEFTLRGIGLNETAIASHLDRAATADMMRPETTESA